MARQYNPQRFFRQAPNNLLEQYFKENGVLAEIKFKELTETKIETIYKAWLALPEKQRSDIEKDFREIDCLATEGGTKAIIDEADWHKEELGPIFSELKSFHDRAFWTLSLHPNYRQPFDMLSETNIAFQKEKALFPKKKGLFEFWLPSTDFLRLRSGQAHLEHLKLWLFWMSYNPCHYAVLIGEPSHWCARNSACR